MSHRNVGCCELAAPAVCERTLCFSNHWELLINHNAHMIEEKADPKFSVDLNDGHAHVRKRCKIIKCKWNIHILIERERERERGGVGGWGGIHFYYCVLI